MQARKRASLKEALKDKSSTRGEVERSFLPSFRMNLGGSGVRVNPLGVVILVLVGILCLYYTFGGGGGGSGSGVVKYDRSVSMKKLLAVSIEMAKRGGAEVKRIRQKVRFLSAIVTPRADLVETLHCPFCLFWVQPERPELMVVNIIN